VLYFYQSIAIWGQVNETLFINGLPLFESSFALWRQYYETFFKGQDMLVCFAMDKFVFGPVIIGLICPAYVAPPSVTRKMFYSINTS
jgi:hypothetical protein